MQQMDSIFTEDELYSVDMAELGVRPLHYMDLDESLENYLGKEQPIHLNVFSAEFQFAKNDQKLTTNEEDFPMSKDDDETNDYIIDPETGERVFQESASSSNISLSSPTDKWLEEYLSNIESSSSNELLSNPTTETTENLPFAILENLVDQPTDPEWFSNLFQLDENSDQTVFNDLINSTQLASPTSTSLSDQTHPHAIEEDHSTNSSNSFYPSLQDEDDIILIGPKLEEIDHEEHLLLSHPRVRHTSTRSTYQSQQDEDALQQLTIPLTVDDITQSTTEEYNRQLAGLTHLSSEQIHLIKDIRRRGKNKIAAQNCRKRKAIGVESLVDDVDELKRVKHDLEERKRFIQQQIDETRSQYEYLHRQALPNHQLPPVIVVQ